MNKKCTRCKGIEVKCPNNFIGWCTKDTPKSSVCTYFSPECSGSTKDSCSYWDGVCECPQYTMSKKEVIDDGPIATLEIFNIETLQWLDQAISEELGCAEEAGLSDKLIGSLNYLLIQLRRNV